MGKCASYDIADRLTIESFELCEEPDTRNQHVHRGQQFNRVETLQPDIVGQRLDGPRAAFDSPVPKRVRYNCATPRPENSTFVRY